MTSNQSLPAVGSVWGVVDDPQLWLIVLSTDEPECRRRRQPICVRWLHDGELESFTEESFWGLVNDVHAVDIRALVASSVDSVWEEVVTSIARAWPGEQMSWHESPTELITRLIDERDEGKQKLDFLKSRGLTVGTMQESGKSPYWMYVIESGSELCDLETVNKLVDAEVQRDKAIELLKRCYKCFAAVNDFLSNVLAGDWDMLGMAEVATESECSSISTEQRRIERIDLNETLSTADERIDDA